MANCSKLFLTFNNELNVTSTKKKKLTKSKDGLRTRIRDYFKKNHPDYKPTFYIQGSKKMGTMIRTKDDECDLDDGVYFQREKGETGTTLQKWVKKAVDGASNTPPKHLEKCIRVTYKGDYHIDLPVYYQPIKDGTPQVAVKNSDCENSDPKEFTEWFRDTKDEGGQLIRIIRYLKSWCDHKRNKMPSGLAMTVLAEADIEYNDRDDTCLRDILKAIEKTLKKKFICKMPTTPKDDLFEAYDETRRNNFFENLSDFISDAEKAIEESNELKASRLWKKHLGDRFPDGEDKDEKEESKESMLRRTAATVLNGNAHTSRSGEIKENNGVKNKPHKNYGG